MILNLIRDEINTLWPNRDWTESKFTVHCSKPVEVAMYDDFLSKGFILTDDHHKEMERQIRERQAQGQVCEVRYQIPILGSLKVINDLDQGYKITKDE